ncbi:hypothetical protein MtrunA17_Chr2g0326981 [Medicago truncatula]|uniref:Uncharacterized protein n=1 Tax=Medicago truncatula TaxID=3880 RepID=A0A396JI34_MEDTR|nr:hypothetical protein MtrunA17_Chr2g0326981 [Medicago truncatula]
MHVLDFEGLVRKEFAGDDQGEEERMTSERRRERYNENSDFHSSY